MVIYLKSGNQKIKKIYLNFFQSVEKRAGFCVSRKYIKAMMITFRHKSFIFHL